MAEPFTLGELLEQPDLDLRPIQTGEHALRREVRGAHALEVERPTIWLEPHWVMITNGERLWGDSSAQRELVYELSGAGITALGLGLGIVFQQPPRALVEAARDRALPLFSIPFKTAFRDVIGAVYRALLGRDARTQQRLVVIQRYLLDAMGREEAKEAVLMRLAELAAVKTAIIAHGGRVLTGYGDLPVGQIWAEIARRPRTLLEFDAEGWHAVASPISRDSEPEARWLVGASRGREFADHLTRTAVQLATPLLAAAENLEMAAAARRRRGHRAITDAIAAGTEPGTQGASISVALSQEGVDFAIPARCFLVRPIDGRGSTTGAILNELGSLCDSRGHDLIAARAGDAVVAILQASDREIDAVLEELTVRLGSDWVSGIGRRAESVSDLIASRRDAELALNAHGTSGVAAETVWFESLELDTVLLTQALGSTVAQKRDELLRRLGSKPALTETLRTFFEHGFDVAATAEALSLHANSVRYRLRQVDAVLGRPLRDPGTITALHAAFELVPQAPVGEDAGARSGARRNRAVPG